MGVLLADDMIEVIAVNMPNTMMLRQGAFTTHVEKGK
jgi:hypothetical protein